jgi:hypothetical protein
VGDSDDNQATRTVRLACGKQGGLKGVLCLSRPGPARPGPARYRAQLRALGPGLAGRRMIRVAGRFKLGPVGMTGGAGGAVRVPPALPPAIGGAFN